HRLHLFRVELRRIRPLARFHPEYVPALAFLHRRLRNRASLALREYGGGELRSLPDAGDVAAHRVERLRLRRLRSGEGAEVELPGLGLLHRIQFLEVLAGVGQAPKLSAAVFAQSQAGAIPQAPVEEGESWYVFRVKSRERADPSKLDAEEMKSVRERLVGQKQGELYAKWVESLRRKARIVENEHVLSYDVGPAHEAFSPDDF